MGRHFRSNTVMETTSVEQLPFVEIEAGVGAGRPLPAGWQALGDLPLLILVGVTGVGKSTTLEALGRQGVTLRLLPDRRALTDTLIIAAMQATAGEAPAPVADRRLRFEYTRRFRGHYAGGMAQALTWLAVQAQQGARTLLFDGLRGADEVKYALAALPGARFVLLDAPDGMRVLRLLGRGDAFDRMEVSGAGAPGGALEVLTGEAASLFTAAERRTLVDLVTAGTVSADDLRAKVQIVMEERRNYDPAAARRLLEAAGPERALLLDTTTEPPRQIARRIAQQLAEWALV